MHKIFTDHRLHIRTALLLSVFSFLYFTEYFIYNDIVYKMMKKSIMKNLFTYLFNSKAQWIATVSQNGWELQEVPPAFKGDREVVLAAVAQEGQALKWASDALLNDQEVVLTAVAQNPEALQYASLRLQDGGLASYVRDILAYDQFVFARRDELQNSASTAVCNQKGLMGEIHAYMGIGLSTHNIQNAQRVASSLGLNTSSEAPHAACRKSTLEVSLSGLCVHLLVNVHHYCLISISA